MGKEKPAFVIAHRGFRGVVPENTMLAAKRAFELGADAWELDVAASSDGVLVVLHDESLARTTNVQDLFPHRAPWSVYDFTFEEIESLDAGSWYAKTDPYRMIAAGRVNKAELDSFQGLKIPTLREALEFTAGVQWKVNIEIKDATGKACDPWVVEKTLDLVKELHMEDSVVVSSFNHQYLVRSKKAAPEVRTAALIDEPIPNPVGTLRSLGAMALNPNVEYLDEPTVKAVRNAGCGVLVWTVNKEEDMRRLLDWGVTGLITDFPDRGLKILGRLGNTMTRP